MATKKQATGPSIVAAELILLKDIHPSATNPRKHFDENSIIDLAESMQPPVGLLQPITLRKNGKGYEIVAGERRYRAAKLLKWESIPSMIREISDEEILEFQILENLQREDVSPMDEAQAFKSLLQKENIDWLASKIHKSKKYIVDRMKLNELVDEAITHVSSGALPLGHAVMISKLPYADQKGALKYCLSGSGHIDNLVYHCTQTLESLRNYIEANLMLDFTKVNFDLADVTLYEKAGSCADCPKRTCNSNLLFQDITSDDKCTDAACFNEKINLHVARSKEQAKEKYGKVLSGDTDHYGNSNEVKVQGVQVKYSETPTKNSVPIVITKTSRWNKENLGKTVYIDSKLLDNKKTEKVEKKGVSRQEDYKAAARKRFVEKIWPRLELISKTLPITDNILRQYFRERFNAYNKRENVMALAGVLGMNGFAKTPEKCWDERDGYGFPFQTEMFDRVIDYFGSAENLIVLDMLLGQLSDFDEDDDDYIDEESYGMTWKNLLIETGLETPALLPAKKSSKKATA